MVGCRSCYYLLPMIFLLHAIMMKKKAPKILQDILIERIGYGGVGIARHADGRKILVS